MINKTKQFMVAKRVSKLYFEITVGEGLSRSYYKLPLVDRDMVFQVLGEIKDFDNRVKEQMRYFKEREENGL